MTRTTRLVALLLSIALLAKVADAQYGRGRGRGRGQSAVMTPYGPMSQAQFDMMILNPEGFEMMMMQREQAAMLKQYQALSREQQAIYKNYQQYEKMMKQQAAKNGGVNANATAGGTVSSKNSKTRAKKKPTAKKPLDSAKHALPKSDAPADSKDAKTAATDKLKVFDAKPKPTDAPKANVAKPKAAEKPKASTAKPAPASKPNTLKKPSFDFAADDDEKP